MAYEGIFDVFGRLLAEGRRSPGGALKIFFSGVQPRVLWISIGGFVFFGAYEQSTRLLMSVL